MTTEIGSATVISSDIETEKAVSRIIADAFRINRFTDLRLSLDHIYNTIPDLIVIDMSGQKEHPVDLLVSLKSDPVFGHIPVVAIVKDEKQLRFDLFPADDYVRICDVERDLNARARLCRIRAERMTETNPLTRLPGNISIIRQIQERLDREELFALAYADLDYFKPYNDAYGFSRGDEVLKMVGRLIPNIVKNIQPQGCFSGHIGGDDFVFIMSHELICRASEQIALNFDRIIPTFYDPAHRACRGIVSVDRSGREGRFPFIGISIGIAVNEGGRFRHYGEIAETATEMKKYAKQTEGSCWRIDRRKAGAKAPD